MPNGQTHRNTYGESDCYVPLYRGHEKQSNTSEMILLTTVSLETDVFDKVVYHALRVKTSTADFAINELYVALHFSIVGSNCSGVISISLQFC
ncbi:hypothetical protein DPMN_174513 [Dreissena polymorpha]|uniref:Uncharacterized protein n=1 Tax=Dreissena polymorpha TaxID=45954 RepID=A0A9D4E5H9_DREPO|nr:hypothetical protein DPMN_174513 [Dreissena polymorpha]